MTIFHSVIFELFILHRLIKIIVFCCINFKLDFLRVEDKGDESALTFSFMVLMTVEILVPSDSSALVHPYLPYIELEVVFYRRN